MRLEDYLQEHAQHRPEQCAIVQGSNRVSYSQLWKDIQTCAEQLRANGLKRHRPYVFRASQDATFVVTYCAVHLLDAIAVPLEHSVSDEIFNKVKNEVEACQYTPDITDILYTTGTSGQAKGVMLSKTCLAACADNFIVEMRFHPELVFIVSGPLNHIASLFKIHPIFTVGGTLCILDGLRDINAFYQVFELPYQHFATFLVPASIRMLLQFSPEQLHEVSHLIDFIETGAAPISSIDMQRLSMALPNSRLYNTYGGTEIGCVCTYQFNDGLYKEGCIGRPMPNSKIEISEDGSLIVSGKTVMSGYVANPKSTEEVLRNGRIYTSDLGRIDEQGLIYIMGRCDDIINIGGYKIDPVEVENIVNKLEGIQDCICIASTHPIIGAVLKLLFVVEDGKALTKSEIAMHIKNNLESYKIPQEYEQVDTIRRTYNGKKDRKSYRGMTAFFVGNRVKGRGGSDNHVVE